MGIRERQERERESVRRAILDAARASFVAEGFEHVSIRKIAERIEYSPAAIYSYFPSKDDIFFALAEEGFQQLYELAARAERAEPSQSPLDEFRRGLWAFYRFSQEYREHFALMFLDRSVPRVRTHYQQFPLLARLKQQMAHLVQRCVEAGEFPPHVDPLSAFRLISAALIGAAAAVLANRLTRGEDADAFAHDIIELFIAGLRSGVPLTFKAQPFPCEPPVEGVPEPTALPATSPQS